MNVGFITPSISRAAGGIFEIERRLGQCLNAMPGVTVSVHGLMDEHTDADLPAWQPLAPQTFPVKGPRGFGYSPGLSVGFQSHPADIAHLHALWMYTSVLIHRWGESNRKPYLVTPNGMLEPWALRNSAWKKRIASLLYERRMLNGAACLQANTEKEAKDIRAYGLKNPIAIIPNGIDLPDLRSLTSDLRPPPWSGLVDPGRKVLLFLSRIHPKKGLLNLLCAWSKVQSGNGSGLGASRLALGAPEWVLAIAGWDQGGHEAELKQLATELGIPWADVRERGKGGAISAFSFQNFSVLFLGPQFNEAKAACYANCDAFILPSFSEGLPMVVLEAWAHGKPVVMTPECNLPEGFAAQAAIRIDQVGRVTPCAPPSGHSIEPGLRELFGLPSADLRALGARGGALVSTRFTWTTIACQLKSTYEWMLGSGPKPDCVQTR